MSYLNQNIYLNNNLRLRRSVYNIMFYFFIHCHMLCRGLQKSYTIRLRDIFDFAQHIYSVSCLKSWTTGHF